MSISLHFARYMEHEWHSTHIGKAPSYIFMHARLHIEKIQISNEDLTPSEMKARICVFSITWQCWNVQYTVKILI